MSDLGPIGPGEIADIGGVAVDVGAGEIAISTITDLAYTLEATDVVAQAEQILANARAVFATEATPAQLETFDAMRTDLERAWRNGSVPPNQTLQALTGIGTSVRRVKITPAEITSGELARWLTLYGVAHGHTVTTPKGTTTTTAVRSITVGGETEGHRTAGGRIVAAAEASVRTAEIHAPGLTAVEAKAISLAIETSYGDTMHVLIGVVNDLVGRITAADTAAGMSTGDARVSTAALARLAARLAADQKLTTGRITAIEKALAAERSTEAKLATKVEGIARQPKTTTDPALAKRVTAVETKLGGIETKIPTLATAAMLAPVAAGVSGLTATQLATTKELQTSGVANLPPTIQQLEDCCYANSQVTKPIKSGGATPSLLRSLGGLLTKGYALLLVAGAVDAVIGIFDMPAVVLGTIRGAEWVMPLAEDAAMAAMNDIAWGDTVAGMT